MIEYGAETFRLAEKIQNLEHSIFWKLGAYECVILLYTRSVIKCSDFTRLKILLDASYCMVSSYVMHYLIKFLTNETDNFPCALHSYFWPLWSNVFKRKYLKLSYIENMWRIRSHRSRPNGLVFTPAVLCWG